MDARRETPAGRQSLIDGRDSAPQPRVEGRRRRRQEEAIVYESERPNVRDGRQHSTLDGRVRLSPGVELASREVAAEVADDGAYRRSTVVTPRSSRGHGHAADRGTERQTTPGVGPSPQPPACRQVNSDALKEMFEALECDETLMSWSSIVAVHAVFDAELVRQQIEVGDAVQNDSGLQPLCKPVVQSPTIKLTTSHSFMGRPRKMFLLKQLVAVILL